MIPNDTILLYKKRMGRSYGEGKNGGNVKEVMDQALEEYIRKYLPDKL